MLTVEACRNLLGDQANGLSDAQLARTRDTLADLARCILDSFERHHGSHFKNTALQRLPSEERVEVEERAAMLEFDGRMSRDEATRTALASRLPPATRRARSALDQP